MNKTMLVIGLGAAVIIALIVFSLRNISPISDINEATSTESSVNSTGGQLQKGNNMKITSPVFVQGGTIPSKYTCDVPIAVSPPLIFSEVPEDAKSLVLLMDDPDVPKALRPSGVFDHWTMFNISPSTTEIKEGDSVGTRGANGSGKTGYIGPCPPPQYEPSEHRYNFALYALDKTLDLKEGAAKDEVLRAMNGHIIERSELQGKYKKINK